MARPFASTQEDQLMGMWWSEVKVAVTSRPPESAIWGGPWAAYSTQMATRPLEIKDELEAICLSSYLTFHMYLQRGKKYEEILTFLTDVDINCNRSGFSYMDSTLNLFWFFCFRVSWPKHRKRRGLWNCSCMPWVELYSRTLRSLLFVAFCPVRYRKKKSLFPYIVKHSSP